MRSYRGSRRLRLLAVLVACALSAGASAASPVLAQAAAGAGSAPTASQLDSLVAPVALYPDPLLANVLAASTFPVQIVEAARDVANGAKPSSAEMSQWDNSVQALTAFPSVLTMMNNQLSWTTELGQAVAQSQTAVMAAVQRVRAEAQTAGNLQSNDKQTVTTQGTTIIIEPASQAVIYVPQYDPVAIITPAPAYVAAPAGYGLMTFGVGFAAGALTAYGCHWGDSGSITVNNNYNYYHQNTYSNYSNRSYTAWKAPSNVGHITNDTTVQTGRPNGAGSVGGTGYGGTHDDNVTGGSHAAADGGTHDWSGADRSSGGGMFGGDASNGWGARAASDRGAQSLGGSFDRGGAGGFGGFRGRR